MRLLAASGIVLAFAGLASGSTAGGGSVYQGHCGVQVLPRGPEGLPAPVEIWTRCGTFRVDTNGEIMQVKNPGPPRWFGAGGRRLPRLTLAPARLKPRRVAWDSGVVPSSSGRLAFTATEGYTGYIRPGYETVYVLERGSRRPRALLRHRVTFSLCGRGVQLWWRRSWLLYAVGEGHVIAFDTDRAQVVDMTRVLRALPGTAPTSAEFRLGGAAWA